MTYNLNQVYTVLYTEQYNFSDILELFCLKLGVAESLVLHLHSQYHGSVMPYLPRSWNGDGKLIGELVW